MYPLQPHHITASYSVWDYSDLSRFVASVEPQWLTSSVPSLESFERVVDLLKKQEEEILIFPHGLSILHRYPASADNPLFYFQRERWLEACNKVQFWKCLPGGVDYLRHETVEGHEEALAWQLGEWMVSKPEVLNLRKLQISAGALTRLPSEIGLCKQLTVFIMMNTAVQELPPQFGELVHLKMLLLSNNRLYRLCPQFQNLQSLERLELTNNLLEDIDPIGPLRNLECLVVNKNQIRKLPPQPNWKKLSSLDLGENQLTEIPESFYETTSLTLIVLAHNQLAAVSDRVSQLTNLDSLFLEENQLTSLPLSLGKMPKLRSLYCTHNKLTEIPLSLLESPSLRELLFKENPLLYRPVFPEHIWTDIK
jgi:hypothetical protein